MKVEVVGGPSWADVAKANLPKAVTVAMLVTATGLKPRSVRSWLQRHGVEPYGFIKTSRGAAALYPLGSIVEIASRSRGSGNRTRGEDRRGGRITPR